MKRNKLNILILLFSLYLIDSAKFQSTRRVLTTHFSWATARHRSHMPLPYPSGEWYIICVFLERKDGIEMSGEKAVKSQVGLVVLLCLKLCG